MVYVCDLEVGKQVYIENQGERTMITMTTGRAGDSEAQPYTFETGAWRVTPILLRTATHVVLQIESVKGHIFIRLQDDDVSVLRTPPLLIGAEMLPLQQVVTKDNATSSSQ